MEQHSLSASSRMVDRAKATRRAYNERKPTKTPKKKLKKPCVNNPRLSSTTRKLTRSGDRSILPSRGLGGAETSSAARWAGPRAGLSPHLLGLPLPSGLLSWRPCPVFLAQADPVKTQRRCWASWDSAGCQPGLAAPELWEEHGQAPPHCLLLRCHLAYI